MATFYRLSCHRWNGHMEQGCTYIPETAQWREEGFCGDKCRNLRGLSSIASNMYSCDQSTGYSLLMWHWLLLLTEAIHTQLHTLAVAGHTYTYHYITVMLASWPHAHHVLCYAISIQQQCLNLLWDSLDGQIYSHTAMSTVTCQFRHKNTIECTLVQRRDFLCGCSLFP